MDAKDNGKLHSPWAQGRKVSEHEHTHRTCAVTDPTAAPSRCVRSAMQIMTRVHTLVLANEGLDETTFDQEMNAITDDEAIAAQLHRMVRPFVVTRMRTPNRLPCTRVG